MSGINWSKLVTAVTALLCVTILMIAERIDDAAGIPVITLVLGYMLGNGVAAAQNTNVQPIFARKPAPGTHLETIEVPNDIGRVHVDIVLGWAILTGGSLAIALGIGWLVTHL
jgi:hypothetical protein